MTGHGVQATQAEPSKEAPPAPADTAAAPWFRRPAAIGAGLGALFVVLSIVMTFPRIGNFASATPGDFGDQFLIQWLLRWDVHGLFSGSDSVLHPNIFWPNRNVLLYSDTELAVAPVAAAISLVTGWTVAYNVVYLSGWVISLASTYLLARFLQASRAGAVLAGLVFTFSAVRLGHYTHFQLQFAYLVPLTLYLLLRFFEEQKWWQAVAVALCLTAVFLNAGYIAAVLYPTVAVVAAGWLIVERFRVPAKVWAGLAGAAVLTAALCLPIVKEYRAMGDFLIRPYAPEATVTFKNFISPAHGSWLYEWLEEATDSPFENRLFPGFLAFVLGAAGGVALWTGRHRHHRDRHRDRRRAGAEAADRAPVTVTAADRLRRRGLLLVLLASTVPLILSFGKWQIFFGKVVPLPYRLVADLPGFQAIRAPGRFAVVPLLALGLLVALGYDRLVRSRHVRTRLATAAVCGAVLLAEYRSSIVMAPRVDHAAFTEVNHALADLPRGPVVELPMADNMEWTWAYIEAPRMVLSSIDWHPRVNGYSGYSPKGYEKSVRIFNTLDDGGPATPEALAYLDELAIRYLVIRTAPLDRDQSMKDRSFVDEAGVARIVGSLPPDRVERVQQEGAAYLVTLRPPGAATSRP